MALDTFNDFCKHLQKCTEQLENELKADVGTFEDLILKSETIDVKLPLQKVKIYHYSEIIKLIKSINIDVRKILYHEKCISKLESTRKLSVEDREFYASSENVNGKNDLSDGNVTRREKRRVASEVSLYTLSTWEAYLNKKEEEDAVIPDGKTIVPKRNRPSTRRKQKKFVSSTFNDILEDDALSDGDIKSKCDSIAEESDDIENVIWTKKFLSYSENDLTFEGHKVRNRDKGESCIDLRGNLNVNNESTKPRIVNILYKKQSDRQIWYDGDPFKPHNLF